MDGTLELTLAETIAALFFISGCAIAHHLLNPGSNFKSIPSPGKSNRVPQPVLPPQSDQGVVYPLPTTLENLIQIDEHLDDPGQETLEPCSGRPILLTTLTPIRRTDAVIPLTDRGERYIRLL